MVQYPAGRLVDRFGHRRVLLAAALTFALGTAGYLLDSSAYADLGWRALQGAASAATLVTSLSYVAVAVPEDLRGRGFSGVTAATVSGIAVGPVLGGLFGVDHFDGLWVITAVLSLAAVFMVVFARPLAAEAIPVSMAPVGSGPADRVGGRRSALRSREGLAVLIVAAGGGLLIGVYESCWTLLLVARHAGAGQITLSWSLFAVPYLLAAPFGGWLVDRRDRRRLMILSLFTAATFAFTYAVVRPVGWLLVLGVIEGVATALAGPAAEAVLSRIAAPDALGRELGALASAQTAMQAVGSISGGALFAAALPLPFVVAGAVGLSGACSVARLMPRTSPTT